MKTNRLLLCLTAAPLLLPVASGCVFLKAPEPDPTPTPVSTPKAPFFDPAAGQSRGDVAGVKISTPLNKAGDPVFPDAFRITGALSGDRVSIQSVDSVQAGNPPKAVLTLGAPDSVRLAGIVAPTTEPGLQGARTAITNWTLGQNVDVDLDGKYPTDLEGVRVVQVFFKGRKGPYEGQTLSLNRMLVRSGHAVVDLYSPTAFDTSQWLLDEAYAKTHKLGFWKFGQAPQQRVPIKMSQGTGAKSRVIFRPGTRSVATKTTQTTTTSSSQTTVVQGATAPQGATVPQNAPAMPGSVPAPVAGNAASAAPGRPD